MDQRRETAERELRDAEQAKMEAEDLRQTYESHMIRVKQEAGQIIQTAQITANDRSEQITVNINARMRRDFGG